MLHRYWFEFFIPQKQAQSEPWGLGCGVTAHDYNDAVQLLKEFVFPQREVPPIHHVIEDVDISTLDEKHVRPNLGVPSQRGVWFPLGPSPSEWA